MEQSIDSIHNVWILDTATLISRRERKTLLGHLGKIKTQGSVIKFMTHHQQDLVKGHIK